MNEQTMGHDALGVARVQAIMLADEQSLRTGIATDASMSGAPENWQLLVNAYTPLLDKRFADEDGRIWRFFGLVHGSDDYYYGFSSAGERGLVLVSCAAAIESYGFTPAETQSA